MNNLNKKEKFLLSVLLGACITFLYIQLYLPKQTAKINELKSSISDYESKLESLELTSKLNINLRKQLDDLEFKYKETIAAFPKEGREPEIAYNYNEYAKKNSIALSNVSIGDSQEFSQNSDKNTNNANNNKSTANAANSGNSTTNAANSGNSATNAAFKLFIIPTTLSVTGEYLRVNDFLATIEKDTRLAKIENITLASGGQGKVNANLTANYYYVPGLVINTEYPFNDGKKSKEDMFRE